LKSKEIQILDFSKSTENELFNPAIKDKIKKAKDLKKIGLIDEDQVIDQEFIE
tara:strand:- start:95 stop:253 length:159 start_codon:yes stop_codon:yes gene_type:complete